MKSKRQYVYEKKADGNKNWCITPNTVRKVTKMRPKKIKSTSPLERGKSPKKVNFEET